MKSMVSVDEAHVRMSENMRKFKPGAICGKQGNLFVLRVGIIFLHRRESNSKKDT